MSRCWWDGWMDERFTQTRHRDCARFQQFSSCCQCQSGGKLFLKFSRSLRETTAIHRQFPVADMDASFIVCLFALKPNSHRISIRHCIENAAKSSLAGDVNFRSKEREKIKKNRLLTVFACQLSSIFTLPISKMKFYCSDFLTVFWLTYSLYILTWGIRSPQAKSLVDTFPLNVSMNSIVYGPNLLIHKNFSKMSWSSKFTLKISILTRWLLA